MLARKIGMLALLCRPRSTTATTSGTRTAGATAFVFDLRSRHRPSHHHHLRGASTPPAPAASRSRKVQAPRIPHTFHDIGSRISHNDSRGVLSLSYVAGGNARPVLSQRRRAGVVDQRGSERGMFSTTTALRGGRRGGAGRRTARDQGGRRSPDYGPARAGQHRSNVSPGISVEVVQKHHQRTGELTSGTVSRLLTSSGFHPRGIKVLLAGGVVGRVQNIPGVDNAAVSTVVEAGLHEGVGYSSSSSSSRSDAGDNANDGNLVASGAIDTGRRRASATEEGEDTPAAAAAPAAPVHSARPPRKFRAERVQGRSWSIEGGEVVVSGAGGEEIPGAAGGGASDFGGRRGRGRRGRGGRR